MIHDSFNNVYQKFKMHFYKEAFKKWSDREVSLTTVETFCMEIIYSLDRPTIGEFSEFANLSASNAADKVNNLIKKGYLKKIQSEEDKRIFYLEVTEKYIDYYNISYNYLKVVMDRVTNECTPEELEVLEKVLVKMDTKLMPEISEVKSR